MAETGKVRWGVIGATSRIAGSAVLPAIARSENATLVAVASRTMSSAQEIAAQYGPDVHAYCDYDSLIADGEVEVVYIPLPNSLHLGWAVEAMNNGKHVLCEQPLALNAMQAAEMVETADANGVILSEAFMYRYHPLQLSVSEMITGGHFGDISLVRASISFVQTDPDDYRRSAGMGGGALLDIGCYGVNIARRVFRREPIAVTAHSVYDPDTGIDTTTTAQLEFSDGGQGLIDCSFSLTQRASYEIVGSVSSLTAPNFFLGPNDPAEYILTHEGQPPQTQAIAPGNMYENEIDALSRRLRGEDAYVLPAEDGYKNMLVIDAIATSARTGERVQLA
jgi:xylose dehydrogenase (NAD/NADP)